MNREQILAYARQRFVGDLKMTDEQFYGVMGSVMGESGRGLDSRAHNKDDPDGGAHGLFQHVGPRWRGLQAFAKDNGKDPYDPRTQIDYVAQVELPGSHSGAFNSVKTATTRREAAEAWTNEFEIPAERFKYHDKRAANADYVASLFGAGAIPEADMNTQYSTSGATDSVSILNDLGMTLLGKEGSSDLLSLQGDSTGMQRLAVFAGSVADPQLGGKFMLDLFGGPGVEGRDLSPTEGIAMALGGYFGGIPGAMAAQGLHEAIRLIFNPDAAATGNPDLATGASVANGTVGVGTSGGNTGTVPGEEGSLTGATLSTGSTTILPPPLPKTPVRPPKTETLPGEQPGAGGLFGLLSGIGASFGAQ